MPLTPDAQRSRVQVYRLSQMRRQIDHSAPRAALMALSSSVSLKGLNKHSTAPCFSIRGRMVSFLLAVIKMTGIFCPRRVNAPLRSGPVMPGMAISRIRDRKSGVEGVEEVVAL